MILMAAVDDRMGMLFHQRRQSQDRVLRQRMIGRAEGSRLWMNAYTARQFGDAAGVPPICVDEDFLQKAGPDEFCFAENVLPKEEEIGAIILYRWNRSYPGDFFFTIDLNAWVRTETAGFAGSSHEKITEEVYVRENQ